MSSAQQGTADSSPHVSLRFQDRLVTGSLCPGPTSPVSPTSTPGHHYATLFLWVWLLSFFGFNPTNEWDPPSPSGLFLSLCNVLWVHPHYANAIRPTMLLCSAAGQIFLPNFIHRRPRGRAGRTPTRPFIFPADHSASCCFFPAAWFRDQMWSLQYR